MFQTLSKKLKSRKGFTLIELIVVLAILGIILAIAVPNYLGVQETSAAKADENALDLAENAVKLWYTSEGVVEAGTFYLYPNTAGDAFELFSDAAHTTAIVGTVAVNEAADNISTIVSKYLEAISTPASSANAGTEILIEFIPSTGVVTASWSL